MEIVLLLVFSMIAISWFGEEDRASRKKVKKYVDDHPPHIYLYEYLRACELYRLYQIVPECDDAIGDALEDARLDVYTMGYLPTNVMNMSEFQTGLPEIKAQPHEYSLEWPIADIPIQRSYQQARKREDGIYGAFAAIRTLMEGIHKNPKYQTLDALASDREYQAKKRLSGGRFEIYLDLMDEWRQYLVDSSTQIQFKPWPKRDVVYDIFQIPVDKQTKQTYYESIALSEEVQDKLKPAQAHRNEWVRKRAIARKKMIEFARSEEPNIRDYYEAMLIFPPNLALMSKEEAMEKYIADQKRLGFYHPCDENNTAAVGHGRTYVYNPIVDSSFVYLLTVSIIRIYNADPVHHKNPNEDAIQRAQQICDSIGIRPEMRYRFPYKRLMDPPWECEYYSLSDSCMSDYILEVFRIRPDQREAYKVWSDVHGAYVKSIRAWGKFLRDTYPKIQDWSSRHAKRMELLELLKLRFEIEQAAHP